MIKVFDLNKYKNWKADSNQGDEVGLLAFLAENAHPEDVLAMGLLFFPDFRVEHDCLLWNENYDPEVFNGMIKGATLTPSEMEQTMNRTLLFDLFPHADDEVDEEVFEKIGKMLQRAWIMHLSKEFPERKVVVDYQNDPSDYGPSITVFQQR